MLQVLFLILISSSSLLAKKAGYDPEACLEPDSVPPHCSDYVNENGEPVFIEHAFNCSRFWVCQPDLSDCLFECAPMLPEGNLYFDVRYQYPVGPVCDWPSAINCTNRPEECGQCEVWQDCIESGNGIYICTPNCKEDVHCDDNEYCDYPDGGIGLCNVGCRNGAVCGDNVEPCGLCVDHVCTGEPECCSDADCTQPGEKCEEGVCKFECVSDDDCEANEYCEGGQCLVGCNEDTDCGDTTCSTCSLADHTCFNPECCSDDDCDPTEYCNEGTCVYGCNENSDCQDKSCSFCGTDHLCVNPDCCEDSECTAMTCSTCAPDNTCMNPECCTDDDCSPDQYCENNICLVGCNEDSDCANTDCSFCGMDHQCVDPECCSNDDCTANGVCAVCEDSQCSKPECCVDDDCDPTTPICSDNFLCVEGCRSDEGCPGYNEVCDATYSNCNYCNATETIEVGSCNPGCITDDNCAGTLVCDGFHQCIPPGVSVNLKQIILVTSACNDCQGTNIENGPILHLKGGEGVDGFPECNTLGLDHEDRVDYAAGSEAVFDEDGDKDVLGTCYRANLDGEVTSGTITWTAEMGTWTLDGNQVDFTWSDASKCKSSCCLDKPLLSPKEPVANLINCKKNCGDNLVC